MQQLIERLLFGSRWLLVLFYLGLVVGLLALLVKFVQEVVHLIPGLLAMSGSQTIVAVLSLIDLSLVGSLTILVVLSGYESFVSQLQVPEARPEWMGKVDFSGLKLKLMGSVVAISAIQLLEAFMNIGNPGAASERDLMWMVAILLAFVVAGMLLALMDRLTASAHRIEVTTEPQPSDPADLR
jgi:uncharacterized protein (TIGR00645 family)